MSEAPIESIIARIQAVYGGWGRETSVAQMRDDWDSLTRDDPAEAAIEPVSAGGVPVAWVVAPGADRARAIVYFHGGGFRVGSLASHRGLMARLSAASGAAVLAVEYRLAPEHRFPAQTEDARTAYDWALSEMGDAAHLALAGDSAGGTLALSLLVSLRDEGRPRPACCFVMSPWTDLAAGGETYATRAESDPIHQRAMILGMARGYLGRDRDPTDPKISPLHADLHGLPPLLIQVGDRETVLDDSRLFAAKAEAAGVDVGLDVEDGMIHVFQLFAEELIEAREAIVRAGHFLRRELAREEQT